MRYHNALFGLFALTLSASVMGHGLVSEPPSRNWTCGAVTPPDRAEPGSACEEAFEDDFQGGYQFMSVLTHSLGRSDEPLTDNVCGFDSSTWDGGATPWDKPIDWPTSPMSAGEHTFTWAIEWGPHFDDTEDFKYWITKPDFEYQVGVPLEWDDFEEEPFCELGWDDNNPSAHPDVEADYANALFHNTCTVPERSGRHVIYAEWGRNYFTYERFHGCIDVQYEGGSGPVEPTPDPVTADINATPSDSYFTGAGEIALSAAGSEGSDLSYSWSLEADDSSLYSLSDTSGETTVLSLSEPQAEGTVTVRLQVSSGSNSDSTSYAFTHMPEAGASWASLGSLVSEARELNVGDSVQLRLVGNDGSDTYAPQPALEIDSALTGSDQWTYALAQAVNDSDLDVRVGVLNSDGDVEPAQSATDNSVYAQTPSAYASAFLEVDAADDGGDNGDAPDTPTASCEYVVQSDWGEGFVADIVITNNSDSVINGWAVEWSYEGNTQVTNGWNADIEGSNPYTASGLGWNDDIQPGESVSFGFQGTGDSGNPEIGGAVCE